MENNWLMEKISFREFKETDFDFMLKWLNTDFVKQWYYKKMPTWTSDSIVKLCTPFAQKRNTTGKPMDCFIILYNEKEIGYLQICLLKNYPESNELLQAGDDSADIDLFIGEKEYIHKGLGSIIIRSVLDKNIFSNKDINKCIISPEPENIVAIKAFKKAGFKYIKTIQDHVCSGGASLYIMEILRSEWEKNKLPKSRFG